MNSKTFFVSSKLDFRYVKGFPETTQEMVNLAIKELALDCGEGEHEISVVEVEPPGTGQRIVCAANFCDGRTILGIRHFDAIMHAQYKTIKGESVTVQGFIDNKGTFLTREQAWLVAVMAGQIIRRVGGDNNCLYSENIY